MGLRIVAEISMPLTKDEAETLMALSMFNVTIANGALADEEPDSPDKACGALDPNIDQSKAFAICTYRAGHKGRHRYVNFGPPQGEQA